MGIIPGVGFWEPYLLKVSRKYLNIGVVIACFDDVDIGFEDMTLATYGLVREVNSFIFEVISSDADVRTVSRCPGVGRLLKTEYVFAFNSYGLANIPRGVMAGFAVKVLAISGPTDMSHPPMFNLPPMPTTLGDNSFKFKLNADRLIGIKNLLRHDKLKSERLFGSLDIMDSQKAKASMSSLLLKSQLGMVMLQPQNLTMLVQLIHQRHFVQVSDASKTVAGLHFMHFEVPNTKPLYHKRILDCATSFVAVLRQIAGGDSDRFWADMFAPFL
jgi:hypothetical protein